MTTKPPTSEATELDQALDAMDKSVVEMKAASKKSIDTSERFARTARAARPSRSNPGFAAIKPGEPLSDSDLTGTFRALKRAL